MNKKDAGMRVYLHIQRPCGNRVYSKRLQLPDRVF
jgi:hypothetical protein